VPLGPEPALDVDWCALGGAMGTEQALYLVAQAIRHVGEPLQVVPLGISERHAKELFVESVFVAQLEERNRLHGRG
jgi:hypothetical protein